MGNSHAKHSSAAPAPPSFTELLHATKVADLAYLHKERGDASGTSPRAPSSPRAGSHAIKTPRPDALVVLERTDPIEKAFHTLNANFILSAPVYDKEFNTYFGFVDVLDLVALLADKFDWNQPELFFKKIIVEKAIDYSHANAVIELRPDVSLEEMIQKMLRVKVHRVAMVNDKNQFEGILTQSDLVSFIARHKESLDQHVIQQSVEELGVITKRPVCVSDTEETLDCFKLMVQKKIGAVGVVEAGTQRLVGQLAAGVLRGLDETNYTDLRLPVKQFLQKHSVVGFNTCKPQTLLADVLSNLYKFRIHRIFVVDDDNRAVGIITLSDIIFCLYHRTQGKK